MQDVSIRGLSIRRGNSGLRVVAELSGGAGQTRPALTIISYTLRVKPNRTASGQLNSRVPASAEPAEFKFDVPQEAGRALALTNGADLTLMALSASGLKYRLAASVDGKGELTSSRSSAARMDESEQETFVESLTGQRAAKQRLAEQQPADPRSAGSHAGAPRPAESSSTATHAVAREGEVVDDPWRGFDNRARLVLKRQCEALARECEFCKRGGGKKYRLFDGIFACKVGEAWAYTFEAESEFHLADDSPVRLTVDGTSHSGSIISSDGLGVTIALADDLGLKVSKAELSAQPWKLLDSLVTRVRQITPADKIAFQLVAEGPSLASENPSSDIRRGQDVARKAALSEPVTVVWGPPGTGKTYTMASVAIEAMERGETVLVVSHSNVSVDGMAMKVAELMRERGMSERLARGDVVRYGFVHDAALDADAEVSAFARAKKASGGSGKRLDEVRAEMRKLRSQGKERSAAYVRLQVEAKKLQAKFSDEQKRVLTGARILATTISKVSVDPNLADMKFDLVILDEASMAYLTHVVLAASVAKRRFVCVGDFRQLAPIAQSADSQGELCRDVFGFLGIVDSVGRLHSHPWLVMLDEQRRMHPDISAFSNRRVYDGLLRDHEGVRRSREPIAAAPPFAGKAAVLADLTGAGAVASKTVDNSRFNPLSAFVAYALASSATRAGSTAAIITPYVAQARICRALDRDCGSEQNPVACSTVHQFQGSERDVVVFDPVESGKRKPGWLLSKNDGLAVTRLVNVAVTRARGKLVCLADREYWAGSVESTNACRALVGHLSNSRVGGADIQKAADPVCGVRLFTQAGQALEELVHDIDAAQERVLVCLSSVVSGVAGKQAAAELGEALCRARARGVEVAAKCAKAPAGWEVFSHGTEDAEQTLVVIDGRVIWCGKALLSGTTITLCARAESPRAARILVSFCALECRVEAGVKVGMTTRDTMQPAPKAAVSAKPFSAFVAERKRCPQCKGPMAVARGRNGYYMRCPACKRNESFSVDFVDSYLNAVGGKCKAHNLDLVTRRGQYGIYLGCSGGCSINLGALG